MSLLRILPLSEDSDSDGSLMSLDEYMDLYGEDHSSKEDAAIRALEVGGEVSFSKPCRFSVRRVA